MSPPSRAAWIEIHGFSYILLVTVTSPPSRAAWIEIVGFTRYALNSQVAAFTGGVD